MSWLKIDDTLHDHPKWVAVLAEARTRIEVRAASRAAAKDAYLVWFGSMVWGSGVNCDGVIPEAAAGTIAHRVALTEDEFLDAAPLLVAAGLWHPITPTRRRCECWRDKKPAAAGWIVHDWDDFQPSKQQVRTKAEKATNHQWLHKSTTGKKVKARVIRRDGVWCRYCGIECRVDGDRRSTQARTFDFVDPDIVFDRSANATRDELDRVVDGVVVACGYCNASKNNRTPEQAEMPLRPPPEQAHRIQSRSNRDPIATHSRSDQGPGPGRVGSGRSGADLVAPGGVGSGGVGSGNALTVVDPFDGCSVLEQRLLEDGLV